MKLSQRCTNVEVFLPTTKLIETLTSLPLLKVVDGTFSNTKDKRLADHGRASLDITKLSRCFEYGCLKPPVAPILWECLKLCKHHQRPRATLAASTSVPIHRNCFIETGNLQVMECFIEACMGRCKGHSGVDSS